MRTLAVVLLFAAAPAAFAQSSPRINLAGQSAATSLVRPWSPGNFLEVSNHGMLQPRGDSENTTFETRLTQFLSLGRVRLDNDQLFKPSFAYSYYLIDINTNDPRLPGDLQDINFALGFSHDIDETWSVKIAGGAGYAGNAPFQDSEAVYGTADVLVTQRLDERSGFLYGLNYNGARSIFPDFPLPFLGYFNNSNPEFTYIVGIPFASAAWRPIDKLTIEATYAVPVNFSIEVAYQLLDELTVFADYDTYTSRFWVSDKGVQQHVIFQQSRAEGGLRWSPVEWGELVVAGGWTFNQNFSAGFDFRSDSSLRDISPQPFIRFGGHLKF